ncbi:probable dolichyl pyrophosphate Man9GlcNAc2 alpha-1,3-glucosyltransferase [Macrosteles quadrilineatus]|uniref:probable dolichyl pyrophosphate Man9GlcNAc2 alpha-1,3-glucosyltransferase n=1 Tax=Macrosteles quadrilineatus TaxID=74068 RepID=UPI0023E1A587|nr:probable dolichyl pyrophosphate Man9GlcNAc2 alpha-1,3-glucosyltransferase [Macrosteles quadrilineatus]
MLVILLGVLLRLCVSLHSYSGKNKPPMFGDYEAQRHWMEITLNLPVKEWYINSTDNDLMYWGLDYPPLTAYHSLLCGQIAAYINSSYVELFKSRGFESDAHKQFMRLTVLVSDLITFVPAIVLFFKLSKRLYTTYGKEFGMSPNETMKFSCLLALTYPGLILIDHGHFQYNCVSLGLFVFAVTAIIEEKQLLASTLFCCAFLYKQMELYHALPFFFYLLGQLFLLFKQKGILSAGKKLLLLAIVVIFTVTIICLPFLTSIDQATQLLVRLFPIARGVFEDKVANFWCMINVIYKLKSVVSNVSMAKICGVCTLVAVAPTSFNVFWNSSPLKFIYSLVNSSLAFFLFSYQVHEKSILLVAIPVLLILPSDPKTCIWFLNISVFSMLPLLVKDQLLGPYIALTTFFILLFNCSSFVKLHKSAVNVKSPGSVVKYIVHSSVQQYLYLASMCGCLVLTVSISLISAPKRYPDIFPLLISAYSCIHFLAFFVYFNVKQWTIHEIKGKWE